MLEKSPNTGKRVCRASDGASTGPNTDAGRQHCAEAKTFRGWETREIRRKRAEGLHELRQLEALMVEVGLISKEHEGHGG